MRTMLNGIVLRAPLSRLVGKLPPPFSSAAMPPPGKDAQRRSVASSTVTSLLCAAALTLIFGTSEPAMSAPVMNDEGTIKVEPFEIPFSSLASAEAKKNFVDAQRTPLAIFHLSPATPIAEIRRLMDEQYFHPYSEKQRAAFKVDERDDTIGGIPVQIFTPKEGIAAKNAHRVLINIHGGAFTVGARTESVLESIPLAGTAKIKVVSVDYRQGPEYRFPAASEDITAVYRELLKSYKPSQIGIFGCSAGGILTGEATAWFQKVGLPRPAGIAILCAHMQNRSGDSPYYAGRFGSVVQVNPQAPAKWPLPDDPYFEFPGGIKYFEGADPRDPYVIPGVSPEVLAKFPPTLLLVGSRDMMASGASRTHIELVKAGVDARFVSWDGLDHNFMSDPALPESREAYQIMANFFEEQFDKDHR